MNLPLRMAKYESSKTKWNIFKIPVAVTHVLCDSHDCTASVDRG
jgi:hypothetical protein